MMVVTGQWKFDDKSVSVAEIEALAKEWASDSKYELLLVRKSSTDQHALFFVYVDAASDSSQSSFQEFNESMKDVLYKRFGVGFVGWDISNSNTLVKGVSSKS